MTDATDPNHMNRVFLAHTCSPFGGVKRSLQVRGAKVGSQGLPVIIDKIGRLLDVESAPAGPTGKPEILNAEGKLVEIAAVEIRNGQPVFFDNKREIINNQDQCFELA